MSQINTNAILDASGGTTTSINGYTPTVSNMAGRNRIINGDMRIDQRNAGASVAGGSYTLDRWLANAAQSGKYTVQQNAGSVTPPTGFTNYLGVTSSSAYSVLSTDFFMIQQRIEGLNIADLGWGTANAQPVTLSFWVRSSLTGTFGGALRNAASNRSYPFNYAISSADTWELKTITIAGDTSGTWLTTNGIGVGVNFGLGMGSTLSGTAGAWAGANYASATGAISVVGTSGATFYITGVQLEAGSVATPFEHRMYGQELALCQRYYQFVGGVASGAPFMQGYTISGQTLVYTSLFPVQMRATPTATKNGTWEVANVGQPSPEFVNTQGFSLRAAATSSSSGYFFANSTDDTVTFSAEL